MSKVGLCMIVKNEENVIERSLTSALPFIQTWLIVDTGSSDKTMEIIQTFFDKHSISGHLFSRQWVNFGYNRTEALELCRNKMDWAIMLDADDTIEGQPFPSTLFSDNEGIDGYTMQILFQGHQFRRMQLFRISAPWRYVHTVHEYAVCDGRTSAAIGHIPNHTYMHARSEGAQSKDPISRAERDIKLLQNEPKDSHTLFHLANSYREAKQIENALQCYKELIAIDTNLINPEKYISMVNIIFFSSNTDEQIEFTKRAIELEPLRLEAQYNLLHRCRYSPNTPAPSDMDLFEIAAAVTNREVNMDDFMVTPSIYEWLFDYEFIFVAFNTKHYVEAYEIAKRCALKCPKNQVQTITALASLTQTYSSSGALPVK